MPAQYGAHEVAEMHEILSATINGINQFHLYRPHVTDPQLGSILDRQIQFMTQEYSAMVQALNQRGMNQAVPYRAPKNFAPRYGLNHPGSQRPNASANEMDDRDVASGMLGCHKAGAVQRMMAALECADPGLRGMVQQSAINCAEQAYEVWQYMNQKGYYQVPTLKEMTTNTIIHSYSPAAGVQAGIQQAGMPKYSQ